MTTTQTEAERRAAICEKYKDSLAFSEGLNEGLCRAQDINRMTEDALSSILEKKVSE